MAEPPDCARGVGQEEQKHHGPSRAKGADDNKLVAPGREGAIDVADAVACLELAVVPVLAFMSCKHEKG